MLFAFLTLEAAFHKFNTFWLITFDPNARFRSSFYQVVCNHKAYQPKIFLISRIIAAVHRKRENSNFWASEIRKWVGGEPFCKIFQNCFEIFHI